MARKRKPASGNQSQPVADIPAAQHGDATALQNQQNAAPMQGPSPQPTMAPQGPQQGGRMPPPSFGPSAFRPTERPGEPITAGIPFGAGPNGGTRIIQTDTVDDFLRALYSVFPDDAILRLLRQD